MGAAVVMLSDAVAASGLSGEKLMCACLCMCLCERSSFFGLL